jgi:hypothetical protein
MRYLWPQAGDVSHLPPQYGIMTRPSDKTIAQGIRAGRSFAVDNEAFTRGFKPARFFPFLERLRPYRENCLFVVVPDVVADAQATLDRFWQWAPVIQDLGFPVAFVAQDGQEWLDWPRFSEFTAWCADHLNATDDLTYYLAWEQWQRESLAFDVLFIGGSTEWKLGRHAIDCIHEAKRLGVPVHIGRVNSQIRFRHFQLVGADFCDGTGPTYAPARAAQRLNQVVLQPALLQI